MFGDTHTVKAMSDLDQSPLPTLRTGVCKIGSGSDFLDGITAAPQKNADPLPLQFAGVPFLAMGKKAA